MTTQIKVDNTVFDNSSKWLNALKNRQDVILAGMLLLAVFMMIIPLPTLLVDVLIAINLMLSILLLMMSVYIRQPIEFAAFPSILLITTLYRLALTISTSRLILLQHDAGEIVTTFGNFAVGGNLVVGLIVFAIITVVQFIVITKGGERVAEVSARFSLDAMPGKQMSIDNDLRAGTIDAEEARSQRLLVQKESQLYGAMDGAMKFVKGDAIASIIVILVNIFGGITVGVFMHDMSAGDAATTYAILSVGDGLISQIPALLISIAAGIIVTRVPEEERENLATELFNQITRQRSALWGVAVVLVLFALLPGFPALIFIGLAMVVAAGAAWLQKNPSTANTAESEILDPTSGKPTKENTVTGAVPLLLRAHPDQIRDGRLSNSLAELRRKKFEALGLPLPEINLQFAHEFLPEQIEFLLYQENILSFHLRDLCLVDSQGAVLDNVAAEDPLRFGGVRIQWVDAQRAEALSAMGIVTYSGIDRIVHLVSIALDRYASELIGVQEARYLMDQMEKHYGELVKELQRQLPIGRIADVLQRLVAESVSIRDLRAIFEALIEWAPREKDPVLLGEYARVALRRHIAGKFRRGQGHINAWILGENVEQMIRESVRQTSSGSYSTLSPEQNRRIVDNVREALAKEYPLGAVIVCALDVRRFLRKLIENEFFSLFVLSHQEIGDEANLNLLGHIELIGGEADALT